MSVVWKLIDKLADRWIQSCPHDGAHVIADLLEGDGDIAVKYCRRCGAVRPEHDYEWRRPRPLWFGWRALGAKT
jgi:hypothetical protein